MRSTAPIPINFTSEDSTRWKFWVTFSIFLAIALFLHFAFFLIRLSWISPSQTTRTEIQEISPKKLDEIRRKWQEKGLLLNKDRTIPHEKEAPPNARYQSDRNHSVEKEQRARESQIIPKPGRASGKSERDLKEHHAASKPNQPSLSRKLNLGIPFHIDGRAKNKPEPERESDHTQEQNQTQAEGGDQAILDRNLAMGSENILNTQESVYYSFYARLYEAIGPIWKSHIREVPYRRRVGEGEYVTHVDVIFDENGNLKEIRMLESSGIPEFDDAVKESWKKIERFPNPPRGLLDQEGEVHTGWTFSVQVDQGFNLQYPPPQRSY